MAAFPTINSLLPPPFSIPTNKSSQPTGPTSFLSSYGCTTPSCNPPSGSRAETVLRFSSWLRPIPGIKAAVTRDLLCPFRVFRSVGRSGWRLNWWSVSAAASKRIAPRTISARWRRNSGGNGCVGCAQKLSVMKSTGGRSHIVWKTLSRLTCHSVASSKPTLLFGWPTAWGRCSGEGPAKRLRRHLLLLRSTRDQLAHHKWLTSHLTAFTS